MSNNTPSVGHIVVCAEKLLKKYFFYNCYLCLILTKKRKKEKKESGQVKSTLLFHIN